MQYLRVFRINYINSVTKEMILKLNLQMRIYDRKYINEKKINESVNLSENMQFLKVLKMQKI